MAEQRRRTLDWRWCLALVLLALVAHAGVLAAGLVYDDNVLVGRNEFLRDAGNLGVLFSPYQDRLHLGYFGSDELSWGAGAPAFHLIEFQLLGLGAGPQMTDAAVTQAAPFLHAVSWLLHAGVVLLCFGLFGALGLPRPAAFVGAALFAIHPVQVEAVIMVSFREDLLATGFTIAACWLAALGPPTWRRAAAMAVLALLACGSKESALVLPALLAVVAWAAAKRAPERAAAEPDAAAIARWRVWIPAAVCVGGVILLYSIMRFVVLTHPGEGAIEPIASGLFGLLFADLWIIGQYLWVVLMPWTLLIDRGVPPSPSWLGVAAGLGVVAGAAIGAWRARRSRPGVTAGVAFVAIALLPVMNVVPVSIPIAERFLYLPGVGLAWLLAEVVAAAAPVLRFDHPKAKTWGVVAAVIVVVSVARNQRRARDFADDSVLWAATYAAAPDSARANANHGLMERHRVQALLTQQRFTEAAALLDEVVRLHERAVELMPGERHNREKLASSLAMRANRFTQIGDAAGAARDVDAAIAQVRRVLAEEPDRPQAWIHLGDLLQQRKTGGDVAESLECYRTVMELEPLQLEPRQLYARQLTLAGRAADGLRVMDATPDAQRAHPYWFATRAWIQKSAGNIVAAKQTLAAGLRRFPEDRGLQANLDQLNGSGPLPR